MIAGKQHAVICSLSDFKTVEFPVVAIQYDTTFRAVCCTLSAEVQLYSCTRISRNGLVCIFCTIVAAVDENHFTQFISTIEQVNGLTSGNLLNGFVDVHRVIHRTNTLCIRGTVQSTCNRSWFCCCASWNSSYNATLCSGNGGCSGGSCGGSRFGFCNLWIISAVTESAADVGNGRSVSNIDSIVKLPLEVAAVHTASVCRYNARNIFRCVSCVAVHDAAVSIKVVISRTAGKSCNTARNGFRRRRNFISIKAGVVFSIWNIAGCTNNDIIISLDDTAGFAGECAFTECICTLSRTHHWVFAVPEVVIFYECRSSHGNANAILCISVKVVVVAVHGAGANPRVTGVRVVIPVVVVSDIVGFGFGLHALQVALAVIPEVVVRVGDISGLFGIQCTIALYLVGIRTGIAIEKVAVMYPDMVVALLQTAIIAFGAVAVHEAQIPNFNVRAVLHNQTKAI